MKIVFVSILISFPFLMEAQLNSSLDIIFGMDHSFRTLSASDENPDYQNIIEVRRIEKPQFNYRFGLNYNHRVNDHIFLKTGIRMARIGYIVKEDDNLRWPSEHDGMGGWKPDPNLPHNIKFVEDHFFIEIPFAGRYEFNQQKLTPFIEAGIMPHVYLGTRVVQQLGTEKTVEHRDEKDNNINTLNLAGNVSVGLNHNLTQKLQIFGQTIFRYHFTGTYDNPISEHLYSAGLELGMRLTMN